MKDTNLVLCMMVGGMLIVGRKFGLLLKNPRIVHIANQKPDGSVEFALVPLPFSSPGNDMTLGGGLLYWQELDNKDIEEAYVRVTSGIILPNLVKVQ